MADELFRNPFFERIWHSQIRKEVDRPTEVQRNNILRLLQDIYFEANHVQIQLLNLVKDFLNSLEFFIVEDRLTSILKFPLSLR